MKVYRIENVDGKDSTDFIYLHYQMTQKLHFHLFSWSLWRRSTKIHFHNQGANASRRVTKRSHSPRFVQDYEKMSANRPKSSRASLCDPANNGHELVKTFSPFAINLHHLCSKGRIIWRILMSYHSSWWTARTLQFHSASLEISNNQYLFGLSITQINSQDHGLNSSFSTMRSQSTIYFSWFRVWSILTILD